MIEQVKAIGTIKTVTPDNLNLEDLTTITGMLTLAVCSINVTVLLHQFQCFLQRQAHHHRHTKRLLLLPSLQQFHQVALRGVLLHIRPTCLHQLPSLQDNQRAIRHDNLLLNHLDSQFDALPVNPRHSPR